ncbi:MAG TPA: PSP1 domain-containing protein, partial [Gemmiger formicilis]|nr:PSP1 domain-containing protein [Gemmiger formicilis]
MKVVSVKFKENGRAYYFDPGEFKIKEGDFVVVTTARGTECGEVVRAAHEVPGFSREVKPVIRVADAVDVRRMRQNRADVQQAYHICEQRIAAHNLKMKLVDAEYSLDRSKLVFYFT